MNEKLERAKEMLNSYIKAEQAILTGQEYNIGNLKLRRADLSEIRKGREYWENEVRKLENNVKSHIRMKRVVIRDI